MSAKPDEFLPTRRTLLSRLREWDDQESWREFFNIYWKLIYGVALRGGLSESEAQDVVQDTIISVARQIPNFRYDSSKGSFKSWLSLITQRRITDHLRKKYRQLRTAARPESEFSFQTDLVDQVPDPKADLDRIWDEEWKQQILQAAMQRVKQQVESSHFQIFDCYVRKEWPVSEVARTFGVKAGQVYLVKHRVAALLAKELRNLEENPI
jgi:RNA polymerase sigma factor (sigma-70 family)